MMCTGSIALLYVALIVVLYPAGSSQTLATITGDVYVSGYGDTLEGAEIKLTSPDGTRYTALGDSKGHYSIPAVPPGRYSMETRVQGFIIARQVLEVGSMRRVVVDVGLRPGSLGGPEPGPAITRGIDVVVKNSGGTPISDAVVVVVNAFDGSEIASERTDRNGRYSVKVQGHQFVLYAWKAGYEVRASHVVISGRVTAPSANVDLALPELNGR